MKFRFKIWSEVEGKGVLGPGRFQLLFALQRTGSINAAAGEVGVSYRRAWGQIREMERILGYPLIISNRGGRSGGGTELTPQALALLNEYEQLNKKVDKAVHASGAIKTGER